MSKTNTTKSKVIVAAVVVAILVSGVFVIKALRVKKTVQVSELEIKLPSSKSAVRIGASQTALIRALGQPKQISAYSSQADYKQGTVLNYNGAKFYFVHDKLANFEISSKKFNVGLATTHKYTTIGNSKSQLPHFYIQNKTALLDVVNDDATTTDQYLEYDLNDSGQVTKISYADY